MMMMTTVTMIPATDTAIEARPSDLALPGSDAALLFAITAHAYRYTPHTMMLYNEVCVAYGQEHRRA